MTDIHIGILGFILLLVLLVFSMPVAFAMAVVGFMGYAIVASPTAAMSMVTTDFYEIFSNYNLTVIPLFVLMGQIAFHAGISRGLFNAAYHWFGPLRGGLAMATVGACTAFGAICGSGPATSATMALVALPEMKRYNYSMELACGAVASGGTLGMMIPPSVVFIVYGVLTQQSIGKLFISGIIPGLLTAALFCLAIYLTCRLHPEYGPAAHRMSWRSKFGSLLGIIETLFLFVLVMGGMFAGWCTPTEAAAVGAAGTLLVALAKRKITWHIFVRSLLETVRTSCMVVVIVAGATVFGHFLARTEITGAVASWLISLPLPAWGVIFVMVLFYLFAGCFVDALALIILTIPIFSPVVITLGYDPIWFGVIIVLVTQMGVITPPVGVCAYVVGGIERDVPLQTIFKGCLPFLAALIVAAILLVAFPQLCLFLPQWIHG